MSPMKAVAIQHGLKNIVQCNVSTQQHVIALPRISTRVKGHLQQSRIETTIELSERANLRRKAELTEVKRREQLAA